MIASAEEAENDSIMSWHPRDSNRQFARAGIIVESKLTEKNDFASVYTLTLSHKNIKVDPGLSVDNLSTNTD